MNADLNQMLVFARVVERGSFIGAAQALGLPKTTVSRRIQELEERLGTRLLQRTTRRITLTESGSLFYDYCARIMQDVEDAELAVGRLHGAPRGQLRVSTTITFGMNIVVPMLPEFMSLYPEVRLRVDFRNDNVDLIEAGYDLAIRVGQLPDSTYAVRQLGETRQRLFASPLYLMQRPAPGELPELAEHATLSLIGNERHGRHVWELHHAAGHSESVVIQPQLATNDPNPLRLAAVVGQGIALLPELLVREELAKGSLLPILPEWSSAPVPFSAVFASRRGIPAKVRVFIDFLADRINRHPAIQQQLGR